MYSPADQLFDFAAQDVDQIREVSVYCGVSGARFLTIVVGCGLLGADQCRLCLVSGACAQVGEFFGAQMTLAPQAGYDDRSLQNQFLSLLIAERNGPAP